MNLLLTLPYCSKDIALLKKNLSWIARLGFSEDHACLLVADSAVPHEEKLAVQALAKAVFDSTETMIVVVPEKEQKWPEAPNLMFAAAARQVQEAYKQPWLWFEPDATPLVPNWLDLIALAYEHCPKRFMGSLVPSSGENDLPPVHLAGCAVYDPNAYTGLAQFTKGGKAFDIAAASYAVPRASNTPLMQHFWGQPDLAPTFTDASTGPDNALSLSYIKPEAVMFHRCKDGTLIDLLTQKLNSRPVKAVKHRVSASPPVPAKPAVEVASP